MYVGVVWYVNVNAELKAGLNIEIELDGNEIYEKNIKPIPPIYTLAKSTPTAIIVDNFYEHPDEIRKFALKQDYVEGGFGRGFHWTPGRLQFHSCQTVLPSSDLEHSSHLPTLHQSTFH